MAEENLEPHRLGAPLSMSKADELPAFGQVDQTGEHGILDVPRGQTGWCPLWLVVQTERGYPRRELATIPTATWKKIDTIVQTELLRGLESEETRSGKPKFRVGGQALSPLVTRELAVLFWALMEDGEGTHTDALLSGWRQLVREERWWLYARASNPAQTRGQGWRRALYYALTDPADTRNAPKLLEIMENAKMHKGGAASSTKPDYRYPDPRRKKSPKTGKSVKKGKSTDGKSKK